jgi:hypothetical protein
MPYVEYSVGRGEKTGNKYRSCQLQAVNENAKHAGEEKNRSKKGEHPFAPSSCYYMART